MDVVRSMLGQDQRLVRLRTEIIWSPNQKVIAVRKTATWRGLVISIDSIFDTTRIEGRAMESLVTGSKATGAVCPAKRQLGNLGHSDDISNSCAHAKAKRLDSY